MKRIPINLFFILTGLIICITGIVLSLFVIPTHVDVEWYSHVTERWIQGDELYQTIVDVNPPMIVLLNTPSVILAQQLNTSAVALFKIQTLLLAFIISAYSFYKIKGAVLPTKNQSTIFVLFLLFLLVLVPGRQLGQREHYILILLLPYLLSFISPRHQSINKWHALFIGITLSTAIGLKPFFIILPIILELFFVLQANHKIVRPETATSVACLIVYVGFIYFITPNYFSIASIAAQTYRSYHIPDIQIFIFPTISVLVSVIVFSFRKRRANISPLEYSFTIASILSLLVGIYQFKGWWNHFYPSTALALLNIMLGIMLSYQKAHTSTSKETSLFLGGTVLTVVTGLFFLTSIHSSLNFYYLHNLNDKYRQTIAAINLYAKNEPVALYSLSMNPQFLLIKHSNNIPATRFACQWFLPGMMLNDKLSDEARASINTYAVQSAVDDLLTHQPKLILFDTSPQAKIGNNTFDFVAYFSQSREFSQLLAEYSKVPFAVEGFTAYLR